MPTAAQAAAAAYPSPVLYFSHPACLEHDPGALMPGHPDTPERLLALEAHLGERGWLGWERREAPAAREADLERVHSRRLVEQIRELCRSGGAIDADTYVVEASWEAALRAAGGPCEMARALLGGEARVGFCAGRPPGHHAEPDRAVGFCLFDNVAVAAALALAELGAERVFIFDWDVHHGNGTAEAFRSRADVLFASIHRGDGFYPGTGPRSDTGSGPGEGFTINLPVPAGSGEELWLRLVERVVLPAATEFAPDLVLISAGFDAHTADPLGGCKLRTESFAAMTCRLRDFATRAGAPLGIVLEGGYEPVAVSESVAATLAAAAGEGEATRPGDLST